jgi:Domain of unknown function (DUF1918)
MTRAEVGDWIVLPDVHGHTHGRRGQVVALLHPDGTPPYRVRWLDDDHESVLFPPPDVVVEQRRRAAAVGGGHGAG